MGDWIVDQIIGLLLALDTVVYGINVLLFNLFTALAKATFPKTIYDHFLSNIYVIIGIFMIFRVAFSLIQMLANPDMISDKEKGVGKIATRIVVAFALIIMVPTIFDLAYSLQGAIIEDNLIGQIILGKQTEDESSLVSNNGHKMAMDVFKGMITISTGAANAGGAKVIECEKALKNNSYSTIGSLRRVRSGSQEVDCFTEQVGGERIYDYKMLVSTIATGMVAWLMVGYCIDVALRLFKLMFLQLIAPVCIVTYVGGGKDNSFNKWIKMTISSYVNVFVKIIVIYFIIYLASRVSDNLGALGLTNVPLGKVAVILGLLVFAKNAPQLIGDLFGVKLDQESGFKGIAKTALLGGAALAAGGGAAGIGSAISKFGAARQAGRGVWSSLGAGAAGLFSGAAVGAISGAKSKNPFKAVSGGVGIAQKKGQQTFNNGTTGWWNRTVAKAAGGLGMQTTGQKMQSRLDALNQYAKGRESIKSIAEGDKTKRTFSDPILSAFGYDNVNQFKEDYERAVSSGMSEQEILNRKSLWDLATEEAINQDMANTNTSIGAIKANMDRVMADNSGVFEGMSVARNAKDLGANYGEAKNRATVLEQSSEYQNAIKVDNAVGNKK